MFFNILSFFSNSCISSNSIILKTFAKSWPSTLSCKIFALSNEIIGLNSCSFLKNWGNCFLNILALVIKVNENGFNCVFVQTARPWIWQMIKVYLKDFACLDSNSILGIIKPFQKLWVDQIIVIFNIQVNQVSHQVLADHNSCESDIWSKIIVKTVLECCNQLLVAQIKLRRIDKSLLDHLNEANNGAFSDWHIWFSNSPGKTREQNHLKNDLPIENDCGWKGFLHQEVFSERQHVHS